MQSNHFKLAGYTLEGLLEIYRSDLFKYYLAYLNKYVYDSTFGGFMWHVDLNNVHVSTDKRAWYDGRGLWVYSVLYRHFGEESTHLKKANQTIDFLNGLKSDDYPYWAWGYKRDGTIQKNKKSDIYGALFVAEGLCGYAAATGDDKYWEESKNILLNCLMQYDKNSYEYIPHYASSGTRLSAPRVLGHWMILLNLSAHLLEQQDDVEIRSVSDRCIETILERHLHPEYHLLVEYLNHDFTLPEDPLDQFVYTGHGIETLWMLMKEGIRREDDLLYKKSAELFRHHVEISWDRVFGGFFHELTHVGKNEWLTDKVLWAQEEVLTGLMVMIDRNKDPWAISWFNRVFPYVRQHFILHDHSHKRWVNGGDRRLAVHHQVDRFENYHHPRHLMLNIMVLEKLATGGREHDNVTS